MKTKDYLLAAIVFITMVMGIGLYLNYHNCTKDTPFIIISTLFSGLAFAFLVYTSQMQKDELELQREEMKLQRQELRDTRAEFEQQNKTLSLQRFENTFFQLLDQFNKSLDRIKVNQSNSIYEGQEAIERILSTFGVYHITQRKQSDYANHEEMIQTFILFEQNEGKHMKKYFNNFLITLEFVFDSELLTRNEKDFYVNILISQLSLKEEAAIFYKLTLGNESEKRRFFITRFNLFQNVTNSLFHIGNIQFLNIIAVSEDVYKTHNPNYSEKDFGQG